MTSRTRPSITKRHREQARLQRQAEKAAKRSDRTAQRRDKASVASGEDPDLVGIVAGPQPVDDQPEDRKPEEDDPEPLP